MCMRPCGPIRYYYRSTEKRMTKKYVMELLDKNDTIVEVFPKGGSDANSDAECTKYTGAISKLKTLIRLGATDVEEDNYRNRTVDGYRNVFIYNKDYPDIIVVRVKKG